MENNGVINSIKICARSGMFFGFNHNGTLCNNIVTGRITKKTRSKDVLRHIRKRKTY